MNGNVARLRNALETTRVSVVVATYNLAPFVGAAVGSALGQSYSPAEVIVVDDGSQDGTREVLRPFMDSIRYVYQDNRGAAVARNTGIEVSRQEFIAFLDADDIWLPDKLAEQLRFLEEHPRAGLVGAHALPIDAAGAPLSIAPTYCDWRGDRVPVERILLNSPLAYSTLIARRDCLPSPAPFTPGRFHADWEFCLRIAAKHQVGFVDKTLIHYRVLPQSMSAVLADQDRVELRYRDRIEIVSDIAPLVWDSVDEPEALVRRVRARESVLAALPSYINGQHARGKELLGLAIALAPSDWHAGGELPRLICDYAKLVFQRSGADECMRFLKGLFACLPDNLGRPERLQREVCGKVHVFIIAPERYRRGRYGEARREILSGLRRDPALLANVGVVSALTRSSIRSIRSIRRGAPQTK